MFHRALAAFLALPAVVAFLIPFFIARGMHLSPTLVAAGSLLIPAGLAGLLWCACSCFVSGEGTIAPWTLPSYCLIHRLYRYSRNPMC